MRIRLSKRQARDNVIALVERGLVLEADGAFWLRQEAFRSPPATPR
jgi:hypothetical protein